MRKLRRVRLDEVGALAALRSPWEALLARSNANEPTLSPTWLLAWWDVFGDVGGRALRSMAFYEGDELVGLAPLLSRTVKYRPGIRFRRLELLASGEDEAEETCSDYLAILASRTHEQRVAESLAEAVSGGELGSWDEIVLSSMGSGSSVPAHLAAALETQQANVASGPSNAAPFILLPRSWNAYLASLSSRRRYWLRKSLRDFEAWAGEAPTLRLAHDAASLQKMRNALYALHEERWGAEGGTGVFAAPRFRRFHERVMAELLAREALWLGAMVVHGEPMAAFYNVVWNGRSYFYQSGRKVDLPAHLRPGVVMHALLIRASIEAGLDTYDFMAGASRYKTAFASSTRTLVTLRAARRSLREVARRTAEGGYQRVRRLRDDVLQHRPHLDEHD